MDDASREALLAAEATSAPDAVVGPDMLLQLIQAMRTLNQRVSDLEQEQNRAALVDALPANAPLGVLIRLRGDATGALYLGNGAARPLTKLMPLPL